MNCIKCKIDIDNKWPYMNINFKTVYLCKECHLGACKAEMYLTEINNVGLDEIPVTRNEIKAVHDHLENIEKIKEALT